MKKMHKTSLIVFTIVLALTIFLFSITKSSAEPTIISDAFGVKLGSVFDASKNTYWKKNKDGSLIYTFNPELPNNIFKDYVVETDENNVIYIIFARGVLNRQRAEALREYLVVNFKIKYGITDSFVEKSDNVTVLHQGNRAIAISFKNSNFSIMFIDTDYIANK